MKLEWLILFLIIAGGSAGSVLSKKLTVPAAVAGAVTGVFVYAGCGFTGIAMMAAFFLSGSWATSWKLKTKMTLGIAEERKGQRRAAQVLANAGTAGITGILASYYPNKEIFFQVLMAGSFAAAAGDTLSSELGNIYGKKYVNILTLKKDQRGLNGVISFEGTLAGIMGSFLIATIFVIGTKRVEFLGIITVAGLAGNIMDSILGATVERNNIIGNEGVNFINTLTGALTAAALYIFFLT